VIAKIQRLCRENGSSLSRLEKELGFSRGALFKWDTNTPGIDKVQKVANYFGVTIDSLVSKEATARENDA